MRWQLAVLIVFLSGMFAFPIVSAARLNVMVYGGSFDEGSDVTMSGKILQLNGNEYTGNDPVNLKLYEYDEGVTGSLVNTTSIAVSDSSFETDAISGLSAGSYLAVAVISGANQGNGRSVVTIEKQKFYDVTTDKKEYALGENATISLVVKEEQDNGTYSPVISESVVLKIRKGDSIVQESTVVTDSDGIATLVYQIPALSTGYGDYIIDAGNHPAITFFTVSFFDTKSSVIRSDDMGDSRARSENIFAGSDSVVVRVVASKETSSGGKEPVADVDVSAQLIKLSDHTTKKTWLPRDFTESDGVYTSTAFSLDTLAKGEKYVVEFEAAKGVTKESKRYFKIQNYDLSLTPLFDENVAVFVAGDQMSYGADITDLSTGEFIPAAKYADVELISCMDSRGGDCSSKIDSLTLVDSPDPDHTKAVSFTVVSSGDYLLELKINTTDGKSAKEIVSVLVDEFAVYADTTSAYDIPQRDFSSGANVNLKTFAFMQDMAEASIQRTEVLWVKDSDGTDVTDDMFPSGTSRIVSSDELNAYAPQDSGCYEVGLEITTTNGTAETTTSLCVKKYDLWADPYRCDSGDWSWEFSSQDNACLHLYIMDSWGSQVDPTEITTKVTGLTNLMSGETFTISSSNNGTDDSRRPITKIALANYPDLTSGFYMADIEVTEKSSGSTETGNAFFQISNFDVGLITKSHDTGFQNYQFGSEKSIDIETTAMYFNGTPIEAANVSFERLVLMSNKGFQEISADKYTVSDSQLTDAQGGATILLSPASGESWSKGDYLAFVNVADGSSEQLSQVWYMVRSMDAYALTSRISAKYSPDEQVSFDVSVTDLEYNGITDVNVTLLDIYNLETGRLIQGIDHVSALTDTWGYTTLSFDAPANPADYFAIFSATHPTTGDSEIVYGWFKVLSGGYVLDASLRYTSEKVVTPGANVNYVVTVEDQDGAGVSGKNITFYKLVNIDEIPHEEIEPTIISSGTTDSEGSANIVLTSPRTEGHWIPMLKVDSTNITDESISQHFDTRYINLEVFLQDNASNIKTTFAPESTIVANISLENPSGGALDMTSLTLVDHLFPRLRRTTTLGASITDGFENYNTLSFTAPEATGNYILHLRSVDGSANRKLISVPFEVGNEFVYSVYLENFTFATDDDIPIQFAVTGGPAKIQLMSVRNTFENSVISNESAESSPVSDDTLIYTIDPISTVGEYELEFCVFTGTSCTDNSDREYRIVNIVSDLFANAWPDSPSGTYSVDEGANINVELLDSSGTPVDIDNINVTSIIRQSTGKQVLSSAIIIPGVTDVLIQLPEPGDYRAEIELSKNGQTYVTTIWFMIEEYQLEIDPSDGQGDFVVGTEMTFNITGSGNQSGKLYILDEFNNWEVLGEYTRDFNLSAGFAQASVTIHEPGSYVATAAIPDIISTEHKESHFMFWAGAPFQAYMDYNQTGYQFSSGEDLLLHFNMFTAGPYEGDVNVTVDIRNPFNWNIINESIFDAPVTVTDGNGTINISSSGLGDGEYDAEVEFTYGDVSITQDYWFRIAGREFFIYTTEWNYDVGQNVTINAEIHDGGMAQEGVGITITNITKSGEGVSVTYIQQDDTTDSEGRAEVSFVLPKESGKYKIQLTEDGQDLKRFITVSTQGYNVWADKPSQDEDKWAYHVGDEFRLDVRVNDKDWNGISGIPVKYTVRDVDDDWNIIAGPISAGNTDADGYKQVSWTVTRSGNFFMDLDIDDGSFMEGQSFSVVGFDYYSYLVGEEGDNTYNDWKIPSSATIILTVDVLSGETPIEGAQVTLMGVRNLMDGSEENATVIQGNALSNSEGRAKLKIAASNLSEGTDFVMRYNISYGNETAESEAWFRITDYTFDAALTSPPTLNDTTGYVTTSKGSGELAFISVNYTGSTDNYERICIDDVRRWDGYRLHVGECHPVISGGMTINFTTPSESGGYDVIVVLISGGDGSTMEGERKEDKWLWFDVYGGNEAQWEVNVWSESGPNAWSGQPKTFRYEMFNRQNWMSNENISGTCGNLNITEIRNAKTWETVSFDDLNIQFEEQEMCTDPYGNEWPCGPSGGSLTFDIPTDLSAGEYSAIILCEDLNIQREAWFRVASFQVSSLMKEIVKLNENVSFWVKITRKDGTPLSGANVTLQQIRDNWNDRIVKTFNTVLQTDSNGEVSGNFIAPGQSGEFELDLKINDGNQTQRVQRWFRIRDLDVQIDTGASEFFSGDDIKITVMVRDPVTLAPIEGANVNLNLWAHCFDMGPPMAAEGMCDQGSCDVCMNDSCQGDPDQEQCKNDHCFAECDFCGTVADEPIYSGDCYTLDQSACDASGGVCQWSSDMGECMSSEEFSCRNITSENSCKEVPECFWDTFMQECMVNQGEMFFGDCPPSEYRSKQTNYEGTTTFLLTDVKKAEYELDIDVDDPVQWRHSWIHKSFNVKKFNITVSTPENRISYSPGDSVGVTVAAFTSAGERLDNYTIEAGIEQMMMGKEGDDCMMIWDQGACDARDSCEWIDEGFGGSCEFKEAVLSTEVSDLVISNGTASFNITIHENVTFSGGALLWMDIMDPDGRVVDTYDLFLIIQNGDVNVSVENSAVSAGDFVNVNLSVSNTSYSISPEVIHLEVQGGMISMNQLMGGGPESGKMDWYESETYLSPINPTHFVFAARETQGEYKALTTITERGKASMGMPDAESTRGVILTSYTVNSSSGQCREDYECNDADNTTADKCVWLQCVHKNIAEINLSAGGCRYDYQCNQDNDTATVEACFNFQCVFVNTVDCQNDYDCDDGVNSTVDLCEDFKCDHYNSSQLECYSDFDCSDGMNTTIDVCSGGICTYLDESLAECTTGAECNDGNPDTVDWCDFTTYSCIHEQNYGNCGSDYDCNDNLTSTFDRCMYGWCENIDQNTIECTTDAECIDSNPDTYDYCDWDMLSCIHTSDSECTPMNEQITCQDNDPATIDRCDGGNCIHIHNSTIECFSSEDCLEGQFCDTWWFECMDAGEGFCWSDQDCGEDSYCMDGWCHSGALIGLYPWIREEYFSTPAEGGDEVKPNGIGNPGADMVEAAMADVFDSGSMLYAHFRNGAFEADFGIGLTQCGGSFAGVSGLTKERFILYVDTDATATSDTFDSSAEYRAVAVFMQNSTGSEPSEYSVEYNINGAGSWNDITELSESAYVNCWPSFVDMGIDLDNVGLSINDTIRIKYVTEYYDGSWHKVDYLPNNGWLNYTIGGETAPVNESSVCGNSIVEQGEQCDGQNLAGQSCQSRGFDIGNLVCSGSCQFDESSCAMNATNATCGNDVVEQGEQCDGENLGGQSCMGLGFDGGPLNCDSSCQFNQTQCFNAVCGNGVMEPGEDCDDSNTENGDGCDSECHHEGPGVSEISIDKMLIGGSPAVNSTAQFLLNISNEGNETFVKLPVIDAFDTACLDFVSASPPPDFSNDTEISWIDVVDDFGYNLTPGTSYLINTNFSATCAINDTFNRLGVDRPWNMTGETDLFLFMEIIFDVIQGGE